VSGNIWGDPVLIAHDAGYSVVPGSLDKQPRVQWKRWQTERQTDEEFDGLGHGSVWGLVTGELYGITIIDFDGAEGRETLERLNLDWAVSVETPGGYHVYVEHPGHRVKNSARKFPEYPGMDTRGDGGIAWFSGRSKKGEYRPVSWPPSVVTKDQLEQVAPGLYDQLFPEPTAETVRADVAEWTGEGLGEPEALRYLTQQAEQVRRAPQGSSNAALNKAAYSVAGLVAGGQLDRNHAIMVLVAAAEMRGAQDIHPVISASFEAGSSSPWKIDNEPADDEFISAVVWRKYRDQEAHEPRPFPVDALPEVLAEFATQGAKATSAPVDYFGAGVLPVLGVAVGGHVSLQITDSWHESANLFTALVGPPSNRKTPALKLVMSPVIEEDMRTIDIMRERAAQSEDGEFEEVGLSRLVVDDATIEALIQILENAPDGVIMRADELAGWVKGMGQYKGGLGRDRQHWLSIWSRDPVIVDRKKAASAYVKNPFVAVVGGIQPEPLEELLHGKDDGLLPRILMAHGEQVTPVLDRNVNVTAPLDEYKRLWKRIRNESIQRTVTQDEWVIPFTDAGYNAFQTWANEHYKTLGRVQAELAGAWGKMDAQAARVALILSRALGEEKVSGDAVERSIEIIRYFQGQATLLLNGASSSSSWDKQLVARTKVIERFVRENPGATKGDIMAMGPAWATNPRSLDPVLDALREMGVWRG
jgi:hypothetical protein